MSVWKDTVVSIAMREGMHDEMFYRDIFYHAKDRLQAYAEDMHWPVAVLGDDFTPPETV